MNRAIFSFAAFGYVGVAWVLAKQLGSWWSAIARGDTASALMLVACVWALLYGVSIFGSFALALIGRCTRSQRLAQFAVAISPRWNKPFIAAVVGLPLAISLAACSPPQSNPGWAPSTHPGWAPTQTQDETAEPSKVPDEQPPPSTPAESETPDTGDKHTPPTKEESARTEAEHAPDTAPASPPESAIKGTAVVVQPGDSLWQIASRELDLSDEHEINAAIDDIHELNYKEIGANPNLVFPGQRLELPK